MLNNTQKKQNEQKAVLQSNRGITNIIKRKVKAASGRPF